VQHGHFDDDDGDEGEDDKDDDCVVIIDVNGECSDNVAVWIVVDVYIAAGMDAVAAVSFNEEQLVWVARILLLSIVTESSTWLVDVVGDDEDEGGVGDVGYDGEGDEDESDIVLLCVCNVAWLEGVMTLLISRSLSGDGDNDNDVLCEGNDAVIVVSIYVSSLSWSVDKDVVMVSAAAVESKVWVARLLISSISSSTVIIVVFDEDEIRRIEDAGVESDWDDTGDVCNGVCDVDVVDVLNEMGLSDVVMLSLLLLMTIWLLHSCCSSDDDDEKEEEDGCSCSSDTSNIWSFGSVTQETSAAEMFDEEHRSWVARLMSLLTILILWTRWS
jgi:hypothetical protein